MEFNIKGIKFTLEDLAIISLVDLKPNTISTSHLFYLLGAQKKPILLLRAGDFIEKSFIEKYTQKGVQSLHHLPIVNEELLAKYKSFLNDFKMARRQVDQLELRDTILLSVVEDFLAKNDECFLTWVIACFETFYFLPSEYVTKYQEQSMALYTRALLVSSMSTIVLLANGHIDYLFLRDFFNLAFMMDYGLLSDVGVDYTMIRACELERSCPGEGISFVEKNSIGNEESARFKNHPLRSFEKIMLNEALFVYPEVIEMIKMHHEKQDGSGFPEGYFYSGLSDTETVLILCDHVIPFEEFIFHPGDGVKVLLNSFESINDIDPNQKLPIRKLMKQWNAFIDWFNQQEGKVVSG